MRIHSQIPTEDANNITPIINVSGKVGKIVFTLALRGYLTALEILDCIVGGRRCFGARECEGTREDPEVLHDCRECRFLLSYEHHLQGSHESNTQYCRMLRNFSSMVFIVCGVNNAAVLRLDKTCLQISYLTVRRFRKCRSYQLDRTLKNTRKDYTKKAHPPFHS